METIEPLVAQAQAATKADLRRLHDLLKQSEETLNRNAQGLDVFLVELDPKDHTLAFLYLL